MTTDSVYTAHDIPDLFAALPGQLGFVPQESLCVIGTRGPRHRFSFSMRVDLPEEENIDALSRFVVAHLERQDCDGAIVLGVSERPELAGKAVWATELALGEIRPVVSAWATKDRYWTTFDDCDPDGYAYTISPHHRAVVQAVLAGQEILPDRAALERRYQPERTERARWVGAAVDAVALQVAGIVHRANDPGEVGRGVVGPILQAALIGRTPSTGDLAQLIVWTSCEPVRGFALSLVNTETAASLLELWAHVARLAPPELAVAPLTLAACSAYLRGDGAQALVALERALTTEPRDELANIVLRLLQDGVPPSVFAGVLQGGVDR
ncbi:DUF4192 domain-containing protein [Aeromicrobium halocynthiae]|uniref:DUF4192 domain-containing protein n=1 Tax=Aeromicrobium halocynthiae TaxID=560557 RepID=UPI0031CE6C93